MLNAVAWLLLAMFKYEGTQELTSISVSMMFVCTSFIMVGLEQVLKAVQKK